MGKKPEINIVINENSGIPIWLQLRSKLIYLISSGNFKCGDQLPTVRELAVDLGINYNTVSKVYQDIERDGYITTKRGKGTFVIENQRIDENGDEHNYRNLFEEFIRQCDELGIPRDEIVPMIQDFLG